VQQFDGYYRERDQRILAGKMNMFTMNILHALGDLLSSPDGREEVRKYISSPEGMEMVKDFMTTPDGKETAGQLLMMILDNLGVPEPVKQSVQEYIPDDAFRMQ
jgi:hypothetical protein